MIKVEPYTTDTSVQLNVSLVLRRYENHVYAPPPGAEPDAPFDEDTWIYVGTYPCWRLSMHDTVTNKRRMLMGPQGDLSMAALLKLFNRVGEELAIHATRKVYGDSAATTLIEHLKDDT